jgi:uncharacterized protein (TIGR03435 family)
MLQAPRRQGGPGTDDPGRVVFHNYPLQQLITEAYSVMWIQLAGPSWLTSVNAIVGNEDKFEIEARMAAGTTKEQYRQMLQSLLEERFALKVHREKREGPVYLLTVNKGGLKINEAPELPPDSEVVETGKLGPKGEDGFPTMPPGYSGLFVNVNAESIRIKFLRRTMPQFSDWLWSQMKRPVLDRTGLTGKYDFYLERPRPQRPEGGAPAVDTGGADLLGAVQGQLGLKLTSDKGEFEMLVVDHAERTPTGN